MANLFTNIAGEAVAVQFEQQIRIGSVTLEPSLQQIPVLLTTIQLSNGTINQFTPTVGGSTYIYNFGDRMGDATISGIGFYASCDGSNSSSNGIEAINNYYRDNRLISKSDGSIPIVTISYAGISVRGYLIVFNLGGTAQTPASAQFTMQFRTTNEAPQSVNRSVTSGYSDSQGNTPVFTSGNTSAGNSSTLPNDVDIMP